MRFTAARIQLLALLFSVMIHLAGAGLVLFMQSASQPASQGAPRQTLQVVLQQVETIPQPESAVNKTAPDQQDDSEQDIPETMPERQPRTEPVVTGNETPAVIPGQSDRLPSKMPDQLQKTAGKIEQKIEKKAVNKSIQRKRVVAASPVMAEVAAKAALSEAERIDYFSRLQAHIEAHKYYPRRARKQSIEGDVEVAFRLLGNGGIDGISSTGGHRLLNHAAQKAVRQALPLPAPPAGLTLPVNVTFSMNYELAR